MKILERFRENPARYAIPWGMTAARPVLGGLALAEARKGNWRDAKNLFIIAALTDLEGIPARFLHATSKAGAIADPIADGILRAEAAVALAPKMPLTIGLITAGELYNLGLNASIQKNQETPLVPRRAKIGTAIQSAGLVLAFRGLEKESDWQQVLGKATMLLGTGLRVSAYRREHKHTTIPQ